MYIYIYIKEPKLRALGGCPVPHGFEAWPTSP